MPPPPRRRARSRTRRRARAEGRDRLGLGGEEALVPGEREAARLDGRRPGPRRARGAQLGELLVLDRVEAQLVEVAQAPRRVVAGVPDRDRAADELVAAGPLHPVDAEEGAADPDGVRRRPRARRVVLRRHEAVAGVERDRDRRAHVDVAEAEHEVGRAEDDRADVLLAAQAVDAADELDVVRAPRRVGADRRLVARDRAHRVGVAPGQREVDDAAGDGQAVGRRQLRLECDEHREQLARGQAQRVVLDVQ